MDYSNSVTFELNTILATTIVRMIHQTLRLTCACLSYWIRERMWLFSSGHYRKQPRLWICKTEPSSIQRSALAESRLKYLSQETGKPLTSLSSIAATLLCFFLCYNRHRIYSSTYRLHIITITITTFIWNHIHIDFK